MRNVKFQQVLWDVAYKMGMDPTRDFLQDQADALATYANGWVRRLYDAQDWPDWTKIKQVPVPVTHIVPYDDNAGPPGSVVSRLTYGRVLKVYLLDPTTTPWPIDTPFRLLENGIHVGFRHGPSVWIKYLSPCPQFTATPWDSNRIYAKDELAYSLVTGECYKSKTNGNVGHDPAGDSITQPPPLTVEITAERTLGNAGLPGQTEILDIFINRTLSASSLATLPDPPPAFSEFDIQILDSTGAIIGQVAENGDGIKTIDDIGALLVADLLGQVGLSGFTITYNPTTKSIRLAHASVFVNGVSGYNPGTGLILYPFPVTQVQPYIMPTGSSLGTPQVTRLSISEGQVISGATYQLVFHGSDDAEHLVQYTSMPLDSGPQILAGLVAAMSAAQAQDAFFTGISSQFDAAAPALDFSSQDTMGLAALTVPPGSTNWETVSFPFWLLDQVERGMLADVMAEQGQTDKGDGEEAKVPAETAATAGRILAPQFDPLTDQQAPKTRYGR